MMKAKVFFVLVLLCAVAQGSVLSGTISVPLNLQFPRSGELVYTGQVGTLADIAAKYDYATATINVNVDNDRIVVIDASTVKFENQQAIVKFTLKTSDGSAC